MKTKNTKPKPRTERPLRVFKMGQFAWIAHCRSCSFIMAYYSHPLAMKAALRHHSRCLYKTTEQAWPRIKPQPNQLAPIWVRKNQEKKE